MGKKLAQLTEEEEQARVRAVDFYRYIGKVEAEAANLAWVDIQLSFPRLQQYDAAQVSE